MKNQKVFFYSAEAYGCVMSGGMSDMAGGQIR